ncbi:glycoside hydrolase family 88 protein [Cohnella lupini]|uniref:Unsaturated chondroitin disaccharide hydrolase n=1 Tax=Cohnella lupini TaxID=1294267 RepID=A0A3D9IJD3_9BACL|nr:unsaturated chondroitin disaccharide hydrolase [Cohnella lupini]
MYNEALEDAIAKTKRNIGRFGKRFPHVSNDGVYELNDNTDWTNGFWSGMLWLSYEHTKDEAFRNAALDTVESFRDRLDNRLHLDHHDIGFLYSLSSKAKWMIERDEQAKRMTIEAADVLMKRWRAEGRYLQAWGAKGDADNGGRIIVDCMMNLPLLYWAFEKTGNEEYKKVAIQHADKSRRFLIRGDDSSYHTFYFNPADGEAIRGGTAQGYMDGSTWTRGQAWAIYGFALSYRYTGNQLYLETAKRTAVYFIEHLPEDQVAYWDFDAPVTAETKRDSSASAIVACGLLEIIGHLESSDPLLVYFQDAVHRTMRSLIERYSTIGQADAQGLLEHGSYSVRGGASPDDFMIWGDYYYMEALMRLQNGHKGYWYE